MLNYQGEGLRSSKFGDNNLFGFSSGLGAIGYKFIIEF